MIKHFLNWKENFHLDVNYYRFRSANQHAGNGRDTTEAPGSVTSEEDDESSGSSSEESATPVPPN